MTDATGTWHVGAAAVDITPDGPIWLHGWGRRDGPSRGVSHPIFVKAAALRDAAGHTAVVVTADLLGCSRQTCDALAGRVGLARGDFLLNVSHNHSGPCTTGVLPLYFDLPAEQNRIIDRYTAEVERKIAATVERALADLEPATLAFENGVCGFATNRRRSRDGHRERAQAVDQDVPVLAARRADGTLKAVLFGYACHPTAIDDMKVNGDWVGYAMAQVEGRHPGATALFVAGCGGDQNPMPRLRDDLGLLYGKILGIAVDEVLAGAMRPVGGPLRTGFLETRLPLQPPPTRRQLEAMLPGPHAIWNRSVRFLLDKLDCGQELPASCPYPVHVWRFGDDLTLIGLTGETVVDYALRFKAEYGHDHTWVAGYGNELLAYVPSLRVLREGSYEGATGMLEYGFGSSFGFAVEETIANAVDTLVQQTGGGARQDLGER